MKSENWILLDNTAIDNIRVAVSTAITQSEIMLRASCARKWYYRYVLRLGKRGLFDHNFVYGTLMHLLLETLYSSSLYTYTVEEKPLKVTNKMMVKAVEGAVLTPKDHIELALIKDKVQIAFDTYRRYYYKLDSRLIVKGVEEIFAVKFMGLNLKAKIDMVAQPNRQDGIFIWDWKTAGKLDALALDAWTFRFQFLFYCWIYWKATGKKPLGTMINGLTKSALRPRMADRKTKTMETREAYLFRIKGTMTQRREDYFYRQRLPLGTNALERFEKEILLPHVNAFQMMGEEFISPEIISALAMQMNTNQCHMYTSYCEYLSLCKDGLLAINEFDRSPFKHPELVPVPDPKTVKALRDADKKDFESRWHAPGKPKA